MQIITDVRQRTQQLLQENSTTLLTAAGVVGTVATAVLAGRASFKAADIIREEELKHVYPEGTTDVIGEGDEKTFGMHRKDKLLMVWPLFIPPVITGGATIGSIVLANRMSGQKAAALAAAYGLSQKQFEEYKGKVAEKLGLQKEQKVRDELAQDRVNKTPGSTQIVIVEGEVLCFDEPTGRYFRGTMDSIKRAINSTNAHILHHDHASASHFYEELGLPATTWTDEVGWNTDQLLDLKFSTVLSEDGKPCIAIDFKTLPKLDYVPRHY
jgi:hypothetical protein